MLRDDLPGAAQSDTRASNVLFDIAADDGSGQKQRVGRPLEYPGRDHRSVTSPNSRHHPPRAHENIDLASEGLHLMALSSMLRITRSMRDPSTSTG
jgi:hypothetical protein